MSTIVTSTMTRLPHTSLMSERKDIHPSSAVLLPPPQSTSQQSPTPSSSPQSSRRYCSNFQQRSTRPWWCGGGGWLAFAVLLLLTGVTEADRLDSLASVLREVTGQLERFNTLYISKLERELSSTSARLAALEATVRAISDRADAWDNIQNHMTVWTDQTRTMDRKLDLLNRCHEKLDEWEVKLNAVDGLTHKLTALDTKINTMTRLEFQVEQVSERVEEVDSKVTWLQKQMEAPEKKPQTQAPIITEFAGRGVLSSLVSIERKLENLSKVVGDSPPVSPVKRPRVMGARFRSLKSTVEPEPGILFTQANDDRVTLCQLHPNDARRIEDVRAKVDLVFDRVTDPDYDYDYFANDLRRPSPLTAPTGTNSASGGSAFGGGGGAAAAAGGGVDFDMNNPERVFARFWKSLFAPFKKFNRRFRSIESQLDLVQKVCNTSTDELDESRNFGIIVERKLKSVGQGLQRRLQENKEVIESQSVSLEKIAQSVGNVAYLSEHMLGEMGQLFQAQNDFMREKFSKTREDIFKYCSRGDDDDGVMTRRDEDTYIPMPPPAPTHPTHPSTTTTTTTTTTTPATVPTRRSSTTTTAYKPPIVHTTSATTPKRWLDCSDLMADGIKRSGVFELGSLEEVNEAGRNYYTRYCDMETAGGGWTVIQRRGGNGEHINFTRDWNAYKNGFGDQKGEFWWGNEFIYRLTQAQNMVIRFDLWDFEGNYTFAEYGSFSLGSETDKYRLRVSDYHGNASDSFSAHNGYLFSTWDQDNDEAPECCPCAPAYGGGWWFYSCFESNLNGEYHTHPQDNDYYRGIIWELWLGDYSLKATEMKLRPAHVSPGSSRGSSFPTPYPGPFPLDPFAPGDP